MSLRRDGPGGSSDLVGHVVAANREWLVLLPEDRGPVWVPRGEIAVLRDVPERVVLPASSADAVERALDPAWPGLRRARLGGWVLRAANGVTKRANSALAIGELDVPFASAVDLADEWYGRPATLQAVVGGRWAEAALAHGFTAATQTCVLVRRISAEATRQDAMRSPTPDGEWGTPDRMAELMAAPATYVSIGDRARGRVAVAGRWAVLTDIFVAPEARGGGLGRAVTRALQEAAADLGATTAAIQVEASNTAAMGLYASEGFEEHHRYCYLSRPA